CRFSVLRTTLSHRDSSVPSVFVSSRSLVLGIKRAYELTVPEINMTELTSLFSTSKPTADLKREYKGKIELRRAFGGKESVLALDDSALDVDQVDNLIKICPTKEEMNIIMEYRGDRNELGICEKACIIHGADESSTCRIQVESVLFKLKFNAQIMSSAKLKTVMKTVLSLGNALNQGTHRGDATGFRLDSLLKLPDTRSNDHRMNLMNYICKVLADKQPKLLDFSKDLGSLQLMHASKLILRSLEGDMHAIQTGLNYVISEKKKAEKDGPVREVNNEGRSPQPPPPPPPYPLRGGVSPLSPVIRSVNGKVPFPPPPPPPPLQRARNVSPPPPLPPSRNIIGCQCPPDHYLFKRCRLSETNSSSTQQQLCSKQNTQKIKKLKPLHWEKITKPLGNNTFWGEMQNSDGALKVPEIDTSELESLFPANYLCPLALRAYGSVMPLASGGRHSAGIHTGPRLIDVGAEETGSRGAKPNWCNTFKITTTQQNTMVFRLIMRWWDVPEAEFESYAGWLDWLVNLRFQLKKKMMFEGVLYVTWWMLWTFRNKIIFENKTPLKATFFDDVPFPPPPPPLQRARNVSPPPPLARPRNVIGCQYPPDHYLFKRCRLSETNSSSPQQQLCSKQNTQKIKKLKPLHWEKITKPLGNNTFWGEMQNSDGALKVPEIDTSELESLFPASDPKAEQKLKSQIEPIRAINCEIILSKVKTPLNELMDHVLALDDSAMDADQVDMLIKHFLTDAEMELLKGCKREKDNLGRCEQFFLELIKVPRAKSKLKVFSCKLRFNAQVSEIREGLNIITSLKEQAFMQTILSLGNALNQGTPRGRASGFKLVSLLKLTEIHSTKRNSTLMHYICKILADKQPDVLDFSKDLRSLEPASRFPMHYLQNEMEAITEGLKNISKEVSKAKNDGPMSVNFRKALEKFRRSAEEEVKSLQTRYHSTYLYGTEDLIHYFEEDRFNWPWKPCCFQVATYLMKFVIMFNQAHKDNIQQIEEEKKKEERRIMRMQKKHMADAFILAMLMIRPNKKMGGKGGGGGGGKGGGGGGGSAKGGGGGGKSGEGSGSMKAPDGDGSYISRAGFESNPEGYFDGLHGGSKN
nr:hypothetical protein [Tanacetum cinerariifolium]